MLLHFVGSLRSVRNLGLDTGLVAFCNVYKANRSGGKLYPSHYGLGRIEAGVVVGVENA